MTDPVLTAAAPELIAVLKAAQTLVTNLGPDPTKLAFTAGPAIQVFLGTVGLQVPGVINAEWGLVQTDANAKLGQFITKLQTPM